MLDPRTSILIVEDNDKDRELIANALTSHDLAHNIVAVETGKEALDFIYERGQFRGHGSRTCLAILDLDLPDSHGFDVLKEMRSHPSYRELPVLVLTGSDSALDAAAARQLGATAFLVKPTDWADLEATVRSSTVFWASQFTANGCSDAA